MRIVLLAASLSALFAVSAFPALAEMNKAVPSSPQQIVLSYAPVVKNVAPAVVNIYTRKIVQQRVMSPFLDDPFFQQFFGGASRGDAAAVGKIVGVGGDRAGGRAYRHQQSCD